MQTMNFSEANCRHCYKCVRTCKVKAIKIINDQAHIVPEKCVACGQCFTSCPQNARNIESDLNMVHNYLKEGKKIALSLAPSFRGFFKNSGKFISALKKVGFFIVEETAIGADIVTDLYKKEIITNDKKNYITTCCPSVVMLIEKYFPEVIDSLMPFVSPMIAHGQLLKRENPDVITVFLGPCIAKKSEASSNSNKDIIDAVLTFDEILLLFEKEGIDYNTLPDMKPDKSGSKFGGKYPLVGGILDSITDDIRKKGLTFIRVDGIDECKEIFQEIINGNIENCCIETSACKKSCIGGPGGSTATNSTFSRLQNIIEFLKTLDQNRGITEEDSELNFSKVNNPEKIIEEMPTEEQIRGILRALGKYEAIDELNCTGCGYDTCRENAISIYQGMSHLDMCIHHLRNKAERLSNEIFENAPNAIILLDNKLDVIDANTAFSRYFGITPTEIKESGIGSILNLSKLQNLLLNKEEILWEKIHFPAYSLHMGLSVTYIENQDALMIILKDLTEEVERKENLNTLTENALKITQGVIEKQMRVAQEIASLLGETTAETKVALNKLKDVFREEGGGL